MKQVRSLAKVNKELPEVSGALATKQQFFCEVEGHFITLLGFPDLDTRRFQFMFTGT